MVNLGYYCLLMAGALCAYGVMVSIAAVRQDNTALVESGKNSLFSVMFLLTLSSVALLYAFFTRDFQVKYVYMNSSSDLPFFYTISGLWAGHEGSMLFWVWMLSVYGTVAIFIHDRAHPQYTPYVIGVLLFISLFFITVTSFLTNPFARYPVGQLPEEGAGLNTLLQHPAMLFHPPCLYTGYVGFTIPFAFSVAALLSGKVGETWIAIVRRWTLFPWVFLTCGIILGGAWAYMELGWGGYWAWDPVENASFMPWLTGTAFLHSCMAQEKRKMLKSWNMALIMITFSLCLFGTFLTRSGILSSVHAFAQSPLGSYFLGFISLVLLLSFGLLFSRAHLLRATGESMSSMVSKESAFLFNNLLLLGAAFAVFLGTVFPILSEAAVGKKISVGMPYFNSVFGPLALGVIVLMGVGPLIAWGKASPDNLKRNFMYPCAASLLSIFVFYALGIKRIPALTAYGCSVFAAGTVVVEFARGVKARMKIYDEAPVEAFFSMVAKNKRRYGGLIVHLGVVCLCVGVISSSIYPIQDEATLLPGQKMKLGKYVLRYEGLKADHNMEKTKVKVKAEFKVYHRGKLVGHVYPAKQFYLNTGQEPSTEVSIRATFREDLYLTLAEFQRENQQVVIRGWVNPLVSLIWVGGAIIVFGTLLSYSRDLLPRRTVKSAA